MFWSPAVTHRGPTQRVKCV